MLETYVPDRKVGYWSSTSLSPGEGSSSLFSLHKRCFQITHTWKTEAKVTIPNMQMNTECKFKNTNISNSDKCINYLYWGPRASIFTKVFNMMKSQHFTQEELSLGHYLDCPFNTTTGTSIVWSVKGSNKYKTLSSRQELSTHRGIWGIWNCMQTVLMRHEKTTLPWLVWLSWLGIILQSERLATRFPVRARAWVMGSVPGWGTYNRQLIDVSLPLFLPPFPSF